MSVRVRFAPSPTGFVHVGSLRTALYNYLFARRHGGTFILRIEDTDRTRFVPGALENLIDVLAWAGLTYDEGPLVGGPCSSYIQSERTEIYREAAATLLERGHAYYCFCTTERLEAMRMAQQQAGRPPKYDKHCMSLGKSDVDARLAAGESHVIRMKIAEKTIVIDDIVRGRVTFQPDSVDDQILIKSDGFPTYHLAHLVDDHEMGITHVIRGEEWLSSTPKHILLYEYFGWQHPQFAHLPLLLNPDRSKLSKRQGDVAVEDYRRAGYERDALINFVAFLGWNPGDEREIFSIAELEKEFSLERVGKAGAIFNLEKLQWLNEQHIRRMSVAGIMQRVHPILQEHDLHATDEYLAQVVPLLKERVRFMYEFVTHGSYFFRDPAHYDPAIVAKRWHAQTPVYLEHLVQALAELPTFDTVTLEQTLQRVVDTLGVQRAELIHPTRLALSGVGGGPGLYEMMAVLGKEVCVRRLRHAIGAVKSD